LTDKTVKPDQEAVKISYIKTDQKAVKTGYTVVTPLKDVPEERTRENSMEESKDDIPEEITRENSMKEPEESIANEHKHKFVPLWMPILAFIVIVLAYVYCYAVGLEVNAYRATGTIGIAALFAIVSAYLDR
jgi:hypothetical protein